MQGISFGVVVCVCGGGGSHFHPLLVHVNIHIMVAFNVQGLIYCTFCLQVSKESVSQSTDIHEKLTEAFEHHTVVSKKLKAAENTNRKNKLKIGQLEVIVKLSIRLL